MRTLVQVLEELGPAEAARQLGVSRPWLSQIRHGRKAVTADLLARALAVWPDLDVAGSLPRVGGES